MSRNRFVKRDLEYQDKQPADPTERVKERFINFCDKWETDLNEFYPSVVNFMASCGTPTNPASKLFQSTIAHIFQHLDSKMKNTKAI